MGAAVWFDLGEGEGVLELPDDEANGALELHVVVDHATSRTLAWWEDQNGAWLGVAFAANA